MLSERAGCSRSGYCYPGTESRPQFAVGDAGLDAHSLQMPGSAATERRFRWEIERGCGKMLLRLLLL